MLIKGAQGDVLNLGVLKFFWENIKKWLSYNFSTLKYLRKFNSFLPEHNKLHILHIQYQNCWWSGDVRNHGPSVPGSISTINNTPVILLEHHNLYKNKTKQNKKISTLQWCHMWATMSPTITPLFVQQLVQLTTKKALNLNHLAVSI